MRVYLAGPLFTQAERRWNRELVAILHRLDPTLEILLPQDMANAAIENGLVNFRRIFEICVEGISVSDAVIGILEGSDSDSGTSFECGYAYALGKPVLGVRTDLRASEDRGLNAMLSQSCAEVIYFPSLNEDINQLASIIVGMLEEITRHVAKPPSTHAATTATRT